MGTAHVQGELWGARANDWTEANEPAWQPVYQAVLHHTGVRIGSRLLDVGCGAGGALVVARQRGAEISGIDASEHLVAIARRRLPNASIHVGEMEELPFADEAFDVVSGINSFQFADSVVRALREARRVCKRDGTVAMLVWGRKSDCELLDVVLPPVFALLPPASSPAALRLAEPGIIDRLMGEAGLVPDESQQIDARLYSLTYRRPCAPSCPPWRGLSATPAKTPSEPRSPAACRALLARAVLSRSRVVFVW